MKARQRLKISVRRLWRWAVRTVLPSEREVAAVAPEVHNLAVLTIACRHKSAWIAGHLWNNVILVRNVNLTTNSGLIYYQNGSVFSDCC